MESKEFTDLKQVYTFLEEKGIDQDTFDKKVQDITKELDSNIDLKINSDVVLNDRINYLKKNFTELFGPTLSSALKIQIEESRDDVVNALYPIIGQMIKKYIASEIKLITEKIDQKMSEMFSWEGILARLKHWIAGTSMSEEVLTSTQAPTIEEVFIIQQDSGLLLGSYSKNKTLDQDMIAGMLTAIKSFMADAFDQEKKQDVASIAYETNQIIIKNLGGYYFAIVTSGIVNEAFMTKLDSQVLRFGERISTQYIHDKTESLEENILSDEIEEYFE